MENTKKMNQNKYNRNKTKKYVKKSRSSSNERASKQNLSNPGQSKPNKLDTNTSKPHTSRKSETAHQKASVVPPSSKAKAVQNCKNGEQLKIEITNVNKDVDEISQKTKKYSRRAIVSNWTKDFDIPKYYDSEEDEGASYQDLISDASQCAGNHFMLKEEKEWLKKSESFESPFSLDLKQLEEGISCVPFYELLDLPESSFSSKDLQNMVTEAQFNISLYKGSERDCSDSKEGNNVALSDSRMGIVKELIGNELDQKKRTPTEDKDIPNSGVIFENSNILTVFDKKGNILNSNIIDNTLSYLTSNAEKKNYVVSNVDQKWTSTKINDFEKENELLIASSIGLESHSQNTKSSKDDVDMLSKFTEITSSLDAPSKVMEIVKYQNEETQVVTTEKSHNIDTKELSDSLTENLDGVSITEKSYETVGKTICENLEPCDPVDNVKSFESRNDVGNHIENLPESKENINPLKPINTKTEKQADTKVTGKSTDPICCFDDLEFLLGLTEPSTLSIATNPSIESCSSANLVIIQEKLKGGCVKTNKDYNQVVKICNKAEEDDLDEWLTSVLEN